MTDATWQNLWKRSQANSYEQVVFSLMLLNGLELSQIANLKDAQVNLTEGWITTHDDRTFPLVSYSREAMAKLNASEPVFSKEQLCAAIKLFEPFEHEAHRRLAGAIWITDETLQLTLETIGSREIPILPLRFTFPFSISERLQPYESNEIAVRAQHVLQNAADWLVEQTLNEQVSLIRRAFGLLRQGSLVFLLTSTGVNGLNLIHNVLMGRLLSPADYSQLTLIITLQLLISLLPSAIQTVVARFSARYHAQNTPMLLQSLHWQTGRFAWMAGAIVGSSILIFSPLLLRLFQLNHFGLILPFILGLPFLVRSGVDRGLLQGLGRYFWLSGAYLSEGVIRLGVGALLGYALLDAGRSLEGAIWGLGQSVVITWFISWLALRHLRYAVQPASTSGDQRHEWMQLGWITGLVLIGQALITNSDFLLVKNFFSPEDAGLYAAVSVLGRIVYFGALPLTILLVPMVARRQALDQATRPILMLLIGGGTVVCSMLVLIAAVFAKDILDLLYGDVYASAAGLLAPYALAASLYTLTNLVITYQIALGSGGETGLPILAGIVQIIGVVLFHTTLSQVITVQIILMGLLFLAVLWRVLHPTTMNPSVTNLMSQTAE